MDLKDKHDGKFVASVFKGLPALSLDAEESEESKADAKNSFIIAVSRLDMAALIMGLISNILALVTCHSLRCRAAQDIALLPPATDGAGFVSNETRQSLGHNRRCFWQRHLSELRNPRNIRPTQKTVSLYRSVGWTWRH